MNNQTILLRQTGYVNAADWCEHIQHNLKNYLNHPKDFELDILNFLNSFKSDFLDRVELGNRKLRENCFEIVQTIIESAIQKRANIGETFKEFRPYVERTKNSNIPVYRMDVAFNSLDESLLEVQVYGNLFTFMLHVDGQYLPTVKALCALKLATEGKKSTMGYFENLKLEQIERLIGEFGSPIFEVYNSVGRHLRNAIAHCNFTYNEGKLSCWDIDPRTKQKIWSKELTLTELSAIINDLKSINQAFVTWFVIRDLTEKIAKNVGFSGLNLKFVASTKK
jgi:hypothetical protein